jgi:N-acetylglucosaminyl-diphospho-decaprenol L-rhamnosyltransferase
VSTGVSPVVRIVVVAYHPGQALFDLLASLSAACSVPYEVVLVDNGGTPEVAGTRRVTPGANLGYGRGANAGAAGATTPWLLVANQDLVLAPGSLDGLLAAGERWPTASVLGPLIRDPAGAVYPSARQLPSLGRGIGHALLGWWRPDNRWTRTYRQETAVPTERTCGWLSGACMLIRTEAYQRVGGFDESYFMFFEDTDLCARLGLGACVYVPSAEVYHEEGQARARHPRRMLREHHLSAFRYLRRQYPALTPVLVVALTLRYLLLAALGRRSASG